MYKKGFTLIELLVVIAIISALSLLLLPNFMAIREKTRDTTRKSDLKQIQVSLELYKQNQTSPIYPSSFPDPGSCWTQDGFAETCIGDIYYLKHVPFDPNKKDIDTGESLGYYYNSVDPFTDYTLCACIENKADAQAIAGNCSDDLDDLYECSSGFKYEVTAP